MHILVLGAGRMAYGLVHDFLNVGGAQSVTIADQSAEALDRLADHFNDKRISIKVCDVEDTSTLRPLFGNADGAVSAVPYNYNYALSKLAIETDTCFVDLGGNNDMVTKQFGLSDTAKEKGVALVPDCGLAPGMVSIITAHAAGELARVDSVRIRVGGLPVNPDPPLNYALSFSVHGLINEYIEPAVILEDGRIKTVPSLTGAEEIEFPRPFGLMEAFYTSGGVSTLPDTFENRISQLDYKTIRYPGHCHIMKAMVDLGFADSSEIDLDGTRFVKRDLFETMLSESFKDTSADDDVILLRVVAKGNKRGAAKELRYQAIEYGDKHAGLTAMMRMTAFPAAIILQMLIGGKIKETGTLKQEVSVPPELFLRALEKRNIRIEIES